jgi:cytoskeletal protein CcmA (bactofilin family)
MMARRSHDDALGVVGAETIIGSGVVVHGNVTSEADIIIDGTLDGSIKTSGNLTIGVNAHVKANVEATNVTVAGTLNGNIAASGEAAIAESGHVKGDIHSIGLSIASGGVFSGRSIMEAPPRLGDEDSGSEASRHITPMGASEVPTPKPKRKL